MALREITINWSHNGIASLTVLYFAEGSVVTAQRTALFNFLDGIENQLAPSTSWSVATEGREVDEATGTLTGFWSDGAPLTGSGQAIGESVPDAAQALLRLRTPVIVRGRLLQGRMFIPGIANAATDNGNLSTGAQSSIQVESNDLVSGSVELGVWSRPVNGSGGQWVSVTSTAVWAEMAVLRRRRR